MPNWVKNFEDHSLPPKIRTLSTLPSDSSGTTPFPPVDPLAFADVPARSEDHEEDDPDPEQDEGDGLEGELLQVLARQRPRYGR